MAKLSTAAFYIRIDFFQLQILFVCSFLSDVRAHIVLIGLIYIINVDKMST